MSIIFSCLEIFFFFLILLSFVSLNFFELLLILKPVLEYIYLHLKAKRRGCFLFANIDIGTLHYVDAIYHPLISSSVSRF